MTIDNMGAEMDSKLEPLGPDAGTPIQPPPDGTPLPPWEEISNGRYMPRRVRGSYLGRELG
jgi:hypothetical protein